MNKYMAAFDYLRHHCRPPEAVMYDDDLYSFCLGLEGIRLVYMDGFNPNTEEEFEPHILRTRNTQACAKNGQD